MSFLRRVQQGVSGVLLATTLAACANGPAKPLVLDRLVQVKATVGAIDVPGRLVSLRSPDGTSTIHVAPEVRNLEQVQVGDEVVVSYYEGLAAQMRKRGAPNDGFVNSESIERASEGQRPAGAASQTVATTVTIEAVDTSHNTVTFRRPDDVVRTLPIQTPEGRRFIRQLKAGDEVDVKFTASLAVAVVPAAAQ